MEHDDLSSPWKVRMDGEGLRAEEVREEDVGLLLARADDSDGSVPKNSESPRLRPGKPKVTRNKVESVRVEVGSGSESDPYNTLKKSSPSITLQGATDGSNTEFISPSPNSESAKFVSGGDDEQISSREVRIRRRQQAIGEEVPGDGAVNVVAPSPKKCKIKPSDEVVKIPMLTGTLYLYRGAKRSVAFVRKV